MVNAMRGGERIGTEFISAKRAMRGSWKDVVHKSYYNGDRIKMFSRGKYTQADSASQSKTAYIVIWQAKHLSTCQVSFIPGEH